MTLQDARPTLRRLFDALGRSADWTDDDAALLSYMKDRWLGLEHGPGAGKDAFDDGALERAWPLLGELGLLDRVDPPMSRYDEVVVMGAAGIGLHRRLELVRESGVRAPRLSVLAGMRPHSGLARDGALDELLAPGGRFDSAPGWSCPPHLGRVAELLASTNQLLAAQVVLPTETDLARLLIGKQWPQTRRVRVDVLGDQGVANELGTRDFVWEGFATEDPRIPYIRTLNGAAVRRDLDGTPRPARPTSRSTIREWMAVATEEPLSTVLVVVNQPHLTRVGLDIRDEFRDAGYDGVRVDVAGCQVLRESADLLLILGEIPSRLDTRT